MDLLYSYIPQWVQSARALRSYDVIKHAGLENCDILRKIGENSENSKFCYKSSVYQNFTGCFAYTKGKGNSKMFCKFQHHSMQIFFFKMANKCFLKTEKVASTPLALWVWRLTLPLAKVVPPIFFHENDRKGCKRDHLYAFGNFL